MSLRRKQRHLGAGEPGTGSPPPHKGSNQQDLHSFGDWAYTASSVAAGSAVAGAVLIGVNALISDGASAAFGGVSGGGAFK